MEPRCDVPTHLTQKHHTSGLYERSTHPSSETELQQLLSGRCIENRWKGREWVLTGECASETTRSFGHRRKIVVCWWYRRNLGNWGIVYFRKLEDHLRGRSSSPLFPSLLQGPNLLKGDTLRGWRLRVGGGRLGLVSTWRAARTRAGTARRASVQDNTTWRKGDGWKLRSVQVRVFTWQTFTNTHETWSVWDNRNLIWWII